MLFRAGEVIKKEEVLDSCTTHLSRQTSTYLSSGFRICKLDSINFAGRNAGREHPLVLFRAGQVIEEEKSARFLRTEPLYTPHREPPVPPGKRSVSTIPVQSANLSASNVTNLARKCRVREPARALSCWRDGRTGKSARFLRTTPQPNS